MELSFERLKYVYEVDIVTSYFKDEETQKGYTTRPRVVPGTQWVLKKFMYVCKRPHRVCGIRARRKAGCILATIWKKNKKQFIHSFIHPFIHWIKIPYLLKLTQLCNFKYSILGHSWLFFSTFLSKKMLESWNFGGRHLRIQNLLQAWYRCRKWGLTRLNWLAQVEEITW